MSETIFDHLKVWRDSLGSEKAELIKRIIEIETFFKEEKFKQLPISQSSLLRVQLVLMTEYLVVLDARIALLEE